MNYGEISNMIKSGVAFFGNGKEYNFFTDQGTKRIVGGVEVEIEREKIPIRGVIRAAKMRDIDGEGVMAGDWLGFFEADTEIKKGYAICINGERYIVTDPRPVMPDGENVVAYRPVMRRIAVHG